jgi:flagellar hook assembly protein FlgD
MTDITRTYYYGGVTASSYTVPGPVYVPALAQIAIPASSDRTVYLRANIPVNAASVNFKIVVENSLCVNAHNKPTGYVTVTAKSGNSFPLETGLTQVITSNYIVKAGHENMMPVSAIKGQAGIDALKINLKNESSVDIQVLGVTITVKDKSGLPLDADKVFGGIRILDGTGNTVYASGVIAGSHRVSFDLSAAVPLFEMAKFTEKSFRVSLDVLPTAAEPFYVELENDTDISTNQVVQMLAVSGDAFGSMKSSVLSLQKADFEAAYHNFPNPFNPDAGPTRIEYYLENQSEVTIKIMTLDGRLVKELITKSARTKGLHYEDVWDGKNGAGGKVKTGVYLCVLEVTDSAAGKLPKLVKKIGVLR